MYINAFNNFICFRCWNHQVDGHSYLSIRGRHMSQGWRLQTREVRYKAPWLTDSHISSAKIIKNPGDGDGERELTSTGICQWQCAWWRKFGTDISKILSSNSLMKLLWCPRLEGAQVELHLDPFRIFQAALAGRSRCWIYCPDLISADPERFGPQPQSSPVLKILKLYPDDNNWNRLKPPIQFSRFGSLLGLFRARKVTRAMLWTGPVSL
jgi:hypothetical protein